MSEELTNFERLKSEYALLLSSLELSKQKIFKLQAENKKLREALEGILKNYLKCSQNEHNNPMIEWKFLNSAKQILKELEGEK